MRDRQVILYLTASRVDVAVVKAGTCVGSRRVPAALSSEPNQWGKDVRQLGESIAPAVAELSCTGMQATVVYDSPTQAADIISSPVRSIAAARSAAELACLDALSYSAMSSVISSTCVGRDSGGGGENTHVAVAAERDDLAGAIAEMTEAAGLDLRSITPIDGALMMILAEQRLSSRSEFGGVLYIGEEHSYFLVGGRGVLRFHRRLSLGTSAMRDSLTRPIRSDRSAAGLSLSRAQADVVLREHGFPERETVVCDDPLLRGSDVIPLMLPGLQRFMVEVRQSLRFGLTEKERADLPIVLTGPGATLPGLADVISTELGESVSTERADGVFDPADAASPASDVCNIAPHLGRLAKLSVLPDTLRQSRMASTIRQCLWTGAAAALVMVGLDGWRYEQQLRDVRMHADAVTIEKDDREALRQTGERLSAAIASGRLMETRIEQELGSRVPLAPLLHEISALVHGPVRLTNLSVAPIDGRMFGRLSGIVLPENSEAEPDESMLEDLVNAMVDSPLMADVVLGNIQAGQMHNTMGISFDIEFSAIGYSTGLEDWRQDLGDVARRELP